jgi:hypothetical protein
MLAGVTCLSRFNEMRMISQNPFTRLFKKTVNKITTKLIFRIARSVHSKSQIYHDNLISIVMPTAPGPGTALWLKNLYKNPVIARTLLVECNKY